VSWKIVKNSDFEPFAYDPLKTNNLFHTEETMESQTLTNYSAKTLVVAPRPCKKREILMENLYLPG
jgi:hypothetical protein